MLSLFWLREKWKVTFFVRARAQRYCPTTKSQEPHRSRRAFSRDFFFPTRTKARLNREKVNELLQPTLIYRE